MCLSILSSAATQDYMYLLHENGGSKNTDRSAPVNFDKMLGMKFNDTSGNGGHTSSCKGMVSKLAEGLTL